MMSRVFLIFLIVSSLAACSTTGQSHFSKEDRPLISVDGDTLQLIVKSEQEWKKELSKEAFFVLRESGTEPSFSGEWLRNKASGTYICAACKLPLFTSKTKFKSGTGWPSFYDSIDKTYVKEVKDSSNGWNRIELRCARCDGHLGHVFEDGPRPTGRRFCINSLSLDFVEK